MDTPSNKQPRTAIRAAQYVRMSTDHQQYSTENQAEMIARYAAEHGMEIVATYADAGKSGLTLAGREELKRLLNDVETGQADFSVVLVYDISRWGRFLDSDESAYHEYVCRRAGINVHYPAEQFKNDGSPVSTLIKAVKRTMAAEYSRELSVKVFAGQCRLIELGFRQGGMAGYGLRRHLVAMDGTDKGILSRGEHKSLQTDRVILVPGPAEEVSVVHEIFDAFTSDERSEAQIAYMLNARGICTDLSKEWTRGVVHQLLTNPKYMGANVYNRKSFKLKQKRLKNPPEMWIRRNDAFAQIITSEQFLRAQEIIQTRSRHFTDDEMLKKLRDLLGRYNTLSGMLIDETEEMPSSTAYRKRFKSLIRAYTLIGFTPSRDYAFIETNRGLRKLYAAQIEELMEAFRCAGATITRDPVSDLFVINEEFTLSVVVAQCKPTAAGSIRWNLRFDASLRPDVTVAVRLNEANDKTLDYYVFPGSDICAKKMRLKTENGFSLDLYRFADLKFVIGMSERIPIERAA